MEHAVKRIGNNYAETEPMTHIKGTLFAMVAVTAAIACRPAIAGKRGCDTCGCKSQVKTVCRLVTTYKEIAIPNYECRPTNVFHPDKGFVCKSGYSCDTFCTLHKNCNNKHKSGEWQRSCHCTTSCGCKTHHAAKSTGCHSQQCVPHPAGACIVKVPVLKWVTGTLCDDCCSKK